MFVIASKFNIKMNPERCVKGGGLIQSNVVFLINLEPMFIIP